MQLLRTTIPVSNLVTLKMERVTARRKMAMMRKMKMYSHGGRDHVAAQEEEGEGEDEEEGEGGVVEQREGTCMWKNTSTILLSIYATTLLDTKVKYLYKQYCASMYK